jgi:ApaG protein
LNKVENLQKYAFSVSVKTEYLADQSDADEGKYAFAYHISITNTGTVAAQLISRHWVITDGDGVINEVRGLGVVGAQPLLQPNEQFQYSSGTLLNTSAGSMRGTYQIVAVDGTQFEAVIEPFTLVVPRVLH